MAGAHDDGEGLTVGELAEASGLTVRTLHHYDRAGLLVPSRRTVGGHRRYSDSDVAALYRIAALRQLGLSLVDIASVTQQEQPVADTLRRQLEQTARSIDDHHELLSRLKRGLAAAEESADLSSEDLLELIANTVRLTASPTPQTTYRPQDAGGAAILASVFEGVTSSHGEVRGLLAALSEDDLGLGERSAGRSEQSRAHTSRYSVSSSVGGLLIHVVAFEDRYVNRVIQSRSMVSDEPGWAASVGLGTSDHYGSCTSPSVSEPPPATFDFGGFKAYAESVFASTFDYVSEATDRELSRDIPGPGRHAIGWSMKVSELLLQVAAHTFSHAGQIAVLAHLLGGRRRED